MVEVTSFTLMALFIARLGTVASASHQIATSLAAVSYMMPLSLAIATSSRASYWLGAGSPSNARAAIVTGVVLTAAAALSLSSALWGFRHSLAHAYAISPAVTSLAAALLAWVALFHLFDAVQAVCVFILRCYRVTVAPLLVYCVLLWGVGLGGGYVLAYEGLGALRPAPSPVTFWVAATAALAVTALIFLLFLWRAMRLPAPLHHPS
jgi:MATE family multidrug resistance protein